MFAEPFTTFSFSMDPAYPCSPVATTRRTILHLRPGQMPCSPLKPCWTRYSGTPPWVNSAPSRALLTAATIRGLDSAVCGFPTRLSTVLLTWLMQKTPLSMNLTELFFSPLPRIWIRPRTLPSLLPYGRSPRSPSRARSRCSAWACSVSAQRDAERTERRTALAGCMDPAAYRTEHMSGAAGGIRTPDPQVRSLMLYPTELRPRDPHLAARVLFIQGAPRGRGVYTNGTMWQSTAAPARTAVDQRMQTSACRRAQLWLRGVKRKRQTWPPLAMHSLSSTLLPV